MFTCTIITTVLIDANICTLTECVRMRAAAAQEEWNFCILSGGFDFQAFTAPVKQVTKPQLHLLYFSLVNPLIINCFCHYIETSATGMITYTKDHQLESRFPWQQNSKQIFLGQTLGKTIGGRGIWKIWDGCKCINNCTFLIRCGFPVVYSCI